MFDDFDEQMDDEQLRQLIASLCVLSQQGDIPLHTFSVLVSAAPCDKLANHLHQRWLSDQKFTKIAAHIIRHRQHMYETDLGLFSCCLAHMLSDFRSRHSMREENRLLFRNSVRAMLDIYPIFKQIDSVVTECLVEPIFTSLSELINNETDDKDIEAMAEIMIEHGAMLKRTRSEQCDNLMMTLRACLCDFELTPSIRRVVLEAMDMWTYTWDHDMIPYCIQKFNEKEKKSDQKNDSREKSTTESELQQEFEV